MPFRLSGSESKQKDLVGIFSDLGKQIKKLFPKKREQQKESETNSAEIKTLPKGVKFNELLKVAPSAAVSNEFSFGVVYANELAKAEIEKENPQFPIGSIIVREKNALATSETPEVVIAMVKRENGFSKETNDWEFFVLGGADLKMQKRETKGDCAACHIRAEKNDWVFRDYLK